MQQIGKGDAAYGSLGNSIQSGGLIVDLVRTLLAASTSGDNQSPDSTFSLLPVELRVS